MKILLDNIGKKFKRDWIVRNYTDELHLNEHTAILGPNGSGKSTLLQLISGFSSPTEGQLMYHYQGEALQRDEVSKHVSYSSPYLEIHERLSLRETLEFHKKMKGFIHKMDVEEVLSVAGLKEQENKFIGSFSSGLKMRIKNTLAILSNNEVVCLDEPLSNIDSSGKDWYIKMVEVHKKDRLFIVCSNEIKEEYSFCDKVINTSTIR